jgi:hypothetical protein
MLEDAELFTRPSLVNFGASKVEVGSVHGIIWMLRINYIPEANRII